MLMMLKGSLAPTITIAMYVLLSALLMHSDDHYSQPQIPDWCHLPHLHGGWLPVGLDLGNLAGADAPG